MTIVIVMASIAGKLFAQSTEDSTAPVTLQKFLDQTHIGGYGEMTYKRPTDDVPRLNIPRFVIYLDHYFSDRWAFKSETEIEDVKIERGAGGEIGLEQAFLDYHSGLHINARAGLLLIPLGIINQTHEPNTFYSVERPLFDEIVIPTTWREIGAGIYGTITEGVKYQLYVTEGLRADSIGMDGMDGGKQEGTAGNATSDAVAGSDASHPAVSAKFDFYPYTGFRLGAGVYFQPNAFSEMPSLNATDSEHRAIMMGVLDAEYRQGPLRLRGEAGFVRLADSIALPGAAFFSGGYIEAAYNVFSLFPDFESELYPVVRYEHITAYKRYVGVTVVPDTAGGPAPLGDNVTESVVAGLAYKPLDNLILKMDMRWTTSDYNGFVRQFSLGAGFSF